MKHIGTLFFIILLIAQNSTQAQGTLTISFDGPPFPYIQSTIPYYVESGMYFDPGSGNNGFLHTESGYSGFPANGSLYLQGIGHSGYNSVTADFLDERTFGISSIDIAGFSSGSYSNFFIAFAGALSDGTRLTTSFSGTGIDFQTFHFGPEWSSGLTGIGWSNGDSPDGWSVDNLVVIVPEPSCGALLLVGGLAVLALGKRKQRE